MIAECFPVLPPAKTHHDGGKYTAVPQKVTAPSATEIVDVEEGPSLVAGGRVPALAGPLHPAVDRVRLDVEAPAFYVGGRGPCTYQIEAVMTNTSTSLTATTTLGEPPPNWVAIA